MSSQNRSGIILFIFAILVLGAAFFWPQIWKLSQNKQALATVSEIHGRVDKLSVHESDPESLTLNSVIKSLESLVVGNNSDLKIKFADGAEIKIFPGSLIHFSGKPKNPQMTIKKGKLEVLSISAQEKLWITQNGKTTKAQSYRANENEDQSLDINPALSDTVVQANTNLEGGTEAPSEGFTAHLANIKKDLEDKSEQAQIRNMISSRLAKQKTRLYRCYSQLLQKQDDAKGKLSIHFTVNNLGKTNELEMVSSQFTDASFHKCLLEVVKRTDFLPFKGESVSTLLPLKFEKGLQ